MDHPSTLISIQNNINELQIYITCLQEVTDLLPKHTRNRVAKVLTRGKNAAVLSISTLTPYKNKTTHQLGGNLITQSAHQNYMAKLEGASIKWDDG